MKRANNFDFLRVLAASMVLFAHQFALTGRPEPILWGQGYGGLGVMIFFCISGYLVAQSWEREPQALRFWTKRVLRIWPGLIVVTAASAFVLGPWATALPVDDYLSSSETLKFFRHLRLSGSHNALPGVFADNPLPRAVNGSLWTIPIEVQWYLVLFLLGLSGILRRPYLLLIGAAIFAAWYFALYAGNPARPPKYFYTFGLFFLAGMCLHYFRGTWETRFAPAAALALVLAVAFSYLGYPIAALVAVLPLFVVAFGQGSTPFFRQFGRYGDFSYGIYIYAFPVQQTLVWLTGNRLGFAEGLAASAACTLALAFLSWHLVEAPSLRLKDRLAWSRWAALRPFGNQDNVRAAKGE